MSEKNKIKERDKKGGGLRTIIGKGTYIEGKLSIQSSGRIDGIIIGELVSTDTIVIGEDGNIQGDVISKNIIIDGKVKGNIYAADRIVLESKAVVKGDIFSPSITINEGSVFNGSCKMIKSKEITIDKKTQKTKVTDLSPEEILATKF